MLNVMSAGDEFTCECTNWCMIQCTDWCMIQCTYKWLNAARIVTGALLKWSARVCRVDVSVCRGDDAMSLSVVMPAATCPTKRNSSWICRSSRGNTPEPSGMTSPFLFPSARAHVHGDGAWTCAMDREIIP